MSLLERIIAQGNRGHHHKADANKVRCVDGFSMSVIAGGGTYCTPKPVLCYHLDANEYVSEPDGTWETEKHDYAGPYTHVEVGFPSEVPDPWELWEEYAEDRDSPMETVYAFVPVEMVRELVMWHGGEAKDEEDG